MKKRLFSVVLALVLCVTSFASCGKSDTSDETTGLTNAKEYLRAMYKDDAVSTPSDFTVVGVVRSMGVIYNVDWSVDVKSGDKNGVVVSAPVDNMVTIDVNEQTSEEILYTLTATISDGSNSLSVSFDHSVPAYKEFGFYDYAAAEDNSTVVCTGVVTALIAKSKGNSSNAIYFQDSDGGFYAYGTAGDPVTDYGLEEGMTIKVTGIRTTYSGTYEITNANVEIVDSNKKTVTPVDFTDKFKNASALTDESLVAQQGLLVTLKGVEITSYDTSSGYYRFRMNGLESYLRISSSVCPVNSDAQAKIKSEHSSHTGWIANVTGVICIYNGAFYLTPVSENCFEYLSLPTKTDAEKAQFELDNIAAFSNITEASEIALVTKGATYTDVTIEWSLSSDFAAVNNGTLVTSVPNADTELTLTATAACGSDKAVKTFTLKLLAPADDMCEAEILDKIANLASGESINGKQVLQGTITEIVTAYSEQYGNITVNMDVAGTIIQCFRLKGEGAADLKVGDVIVVTGEIKNYNGTIEFNSGCTFSKTLSVDEAKQLVVLEKAFALEAGTAMNGTQVLRGTVSKIDSAYSDAYKNISVYIDIADYSVLCYRLTGTDAATLAVGDTITVTGVIKNYNGTIEFDKGCTFEKDQTIGEAKDLVVMAKAYALESGAAMVGKQEVKGTITEIVTAYSEQYGNITVNMLVGDEYVIMCFRMKGEGAGELKVGDVITVTGEIKNYNGTIEFNSGCTFTK